MKSKGTKRIIERLQKDGVKLSEHEGMYARLISTSITLTYLIPEIIAAEVVHPGDITVKFTGMPYPRVHALYSHIQLL